MSITEGILETISGLFGKVFGTANERELRALWPLVERINEEWGKLRALSDEALAAKSDEFRRRLIKGETLDDILPEAFAVCREASHRTHGERKSVRGKYDRITYQNGKFLYVPEEGEMPYFAHFDVQLIGGIVLHQGKIAEMVTGEGKTLVATLPCYLNALVPEPKWIEKARELQGENVDNWVFKPYVQMSEEGPWELADRLMPQAGDVSWRMPLRIIPRGQGVHVVTVNDYLAARDAEYSSRIFNFLGLEVGAIQASMDSRQRIPIYYSDIVYGTNNEFGFDYLRDNLKVTPESQVQRSRIYAIIDEVDSVLIDEARTPLIISGSTHESSDKYFAADNVARRLKGIDQNGLEELIAKKMKQGFQREDARMAAEEESGSDYVYSERDHNVKLTERGIHEAMKVLGTDDIYSGSNMDMPHYIDNALKAHALYKCDTHYIVNDGKVYIVDEFTGRVLEGRRWSDGLHQAVEAKEGLKIKEESQTIASITFQNFFKLYRKLGGMTGTAMTEAKEFMNIYKLGVVSIPTNRPLRRINFPDLIYGTMREKYTAIAEHVQEVHKTGQPILIGTVSIEHSEIVSASLKVRGVKHEVLNAKHHAREAEIVAKAGQLGQVTVATNMAGRGTDIKLGSCTQEQLLEHWREWGLAPKNATLGQMSEEKLNDELLRNWVEHYLKMGAEYESKTPAEWKQILKEFWRDCGLHGPELGDSVTALGGLHIVGSERHEARRIDNQLRGRSGRQGDPGSSRFFLSLEDDTMRLFAPERARQFMQWAGLKNGEAIESRLVTRTVEKSQRKVEERNFEARKHVLEYDEVMNEQRLVIYSRRQAWLEGRELRESMLGFCENHIVGRLSTYAAATDAWSAGYVQDFMEEDFLLKLPEADIERVHSEPDGENRLADYLCEKLREAYGQKERNISTENMRMLEKLLLLETIDRKWMDHLYAMDLLKEGIHLRGYAGQDPKIRYKVEGFELFQEMWLSLQADVAQLIMKVRPAENMQVEEQVNIGQSIHSDFDAFAADAESKGANAGGATPVTITNVFPKTGANDPCPCGSGKKFKKCCGRQ